jgi:hypothetical protein
MRDYNKQVDLDDKQKSVIIDLLEIARENEDDQTIKSLKERLKICFGLNFDK